MTSNDVKLFSEFSLRSVTLKNRIVISPMGTYSAENGALQPFHHTHYASFAMGGAGLVMFGMVAATGIRILGAVDFKNNRNNLFIAALAIGFGMIPLVAPTFFNKFPEELKPLLESGILLTSIVAVVLNLYFNGYSKISREEAIAAAHAAEA